MTLSEFKIWLEGYSDALGKKPEDMTAPQLKLIVLKMAEVEQDIAPYIGLPYPVYPTPTVPQYPYSQRWWYSGTSSNVGHTVTVSGVTIPDENTFNTSEWSN